ncbi:MAG: gamma-glutamyl-gamma-aminobutyrate hydrolase family protein [Candidatus Rokubacteria bacterium]|nr:gamma-glutamyl-gamma-aminobutyrate hydrolase family protein [Candidatus Rokubacteria bacterium]MBI2554858.1 gamma-glutamyl-gamma-aminobutyrate hydrolase family protein [Candidatus Rokubacteria bacterium]
MSRPPLIGVTTSITVGKQPERAYVNSAYLAAIQTAGGVPVPVTPQLDARSQQELLARCDGFLLTGGGDLDPAAFNEPPHPTLYEVAPARDRLEIALVHHAMESRKPLLAVCRGIQVLNVALGGSLFQDVASDPGSEIQHQQDKDDTPRNEPTHPVKVVAGSRLAQVLGTTDLRVNSMHHQAVKAVGRGLVPVAFAPDMVIEGVELEEPDRFVLGVQWHPEELTDRDPSARRLFGALVAAATRA